MKRGAALQSNGAAYRVFVVETFIHLTGDKLAPSYYVLIAAVLSDTSLVIVAWRMRRVRHVERVQHARSSALAGVYCSAAIIAASDFEAMYPHTSQLLELVFLCRPRAFLFLTEYFDYLDIGTAAVRHGLCWVICRVVKHRLRCKIQGVNSNSRRCI